MNERWPEHDLALWFHELRAEDERGAPAFDDVVRARSFADVPARPERRWRSALRIGAMAAMLMLIVWATLQFRTRGLRDSTPYAGWSGEFVSVESPAIPWQTVVLIAEWRSPTDFLLSTPDGWPREDGSYSDDVF